MAESSAAKVDYVSKVAEATKLGFSRVTIIDRATYTCVGASAADAVAVAYPDPTDSTQQINENVELHEWGKRGGKVKTSFWFYKQKFNILQRLEEGRAIICLAGKDILVGFQFKSVWFLASSEIAGASASEDSAAEATKSAASFRNAQAAYGKIWTEIWEDMANDEEEE